MSETWIYHYGVKGMKWGIRRTPEQLGHVKKRVAKKTESDIIEDTTVVDAIRNGEVSTKVNREKQARHIKAGKDYIEGRSYMYGTIDDMQAFIDRYAGKGKAVFDKSGIRWLNKERVQGDRPVGKRVNPDNETETETDKAMIVYSKTGAHVYPRKDDE